jgi:ribonuclease PH
VALAIALAKLRQSGKLNRDPLTTAVAAVSVGIVKGKPVLDLDYAEDSTAYVDCNVIGTLDEEFVEIQATAEGKPFSRTALTSLLDLAELGLAELFAAQREAIRIATTAR